MRAVLVVAAALCAPAIAAQTSPFEMRDAKARVVEAEPSAEAPFELRGQFRVEKPAVDPGEPFVLVPASQKAGVGCGAPSEERVFANGFEE